MTLIRADRRRAQIAITARGGRNRRPGASGARRRSYWACKSLSSAGRGSCAPPPPPPGGAARSRAHHFRRRQLAQSFIWSGHKSCSLGRCLDNGLLGRLRARANESELRANESFVLGLRPIAALCASGRRSGRTPPVGRVCSRRSRRAAVDAAAAGSHTRSSAARTGNRFYLSRVAMAVRCPLGACARAKALSRTTTAMTTTTSRRKPHHSTREPSTPLRRARTRATPQVSAQIAAAAAGSGTFVRARGGCRTCSLSPLFAGSGAVCCGLAGKVVASASATPTPTKLTTRVVRLFAAGERKRASFP